MKKYKHTRKNHVKRIKEIANQNWVDKQDATEIDRLCNLLLQTKKTKKRDCSCPNRKSNPMIVDPQCPRHKHPLPFEKETLEGLKKITILVERV